MLHIIANRFTLTEFLLDSLPADQRARVVMHPKRIKGNAYSLLKALDAWLPWRLPGFRPFPEDYLRQLEAIAPDASVLIFGIENIKDLRIVRKYLRTRRVSVFTWNPVMDYQQIPWVRRHHIRQLKGLGFKVSTFDPGDARRYGLSLVRQVYRPVDDLREPLAQDIDIYFLGKDKHRFDRLQSLGRTWCDQGLHVRLLVIAEPGERHPPSAVVEVRQEALGYRENIALIQRSRCLLELTQANQTGLTIRCLEAMFFDRKLVTNNPLVRTLPFYDPARFFVLGQDDLSDMPRFLRAPLRPLSQDVLAGYAFPQWIRQFDGAPPT
ncbi:hypothetical protein GN316_09415 [Xylophilus sp. Kf1]|nr:hypothetical protein [Xylophilus sp. Kf1]